MNYKHCCVIDASGNYKTFVLVKSETDPMTGQNMETVQYYILAEGERLVDTTPPILRPHAGAAGMDVETSQGKEHFALQETDQINLSTALSAIQAGATGYPYHADGQLCRMFTAEEIQAIAQTATLYKLEHTTYYNHIAAWVRRAEAAELAGITYGADLPEDLADNMAAILGAAQGGIANV